MCGITGYIGERPAVETALNNLKRLEYRGYDSAGIAYPNHAKVQIVRATGKIANLEEALRGGSHEASVAIAHTRWATHGSPTHDNAHPHRDCTGRVAVVHNGIIENYGELRRELIAEGHGFGSETDTEVIAHLIERELAAIAGRPPHAPLSRIAPRCANSEGNPHPLPLSLEGRGETDTADCSPGSFAGVERGLILPLSYERSEWYP